MINGSLNFVMRKRLTGLVVPLPKLNRTPALGCLASLVSVWNLAHQNQVQGVHPAPIVPFMAGFSRTFSKMVMTRMTSIA